MEISQKRKDYLRNYQREWRKKRRAEYFNGKSCVKCGSTERLELDHIDPKKKKSHKIWSWSKTKQQEEIAKCQILCRPCHWDKTKAQNGWGVPRHGFVNTYEKFACRCEPCRKAKGVKMARYKRNKKLRDSLRSSQ